MTTNRNKVTDKHLEHLIKAVIAQPNISPYYLSVHLLKTKYYISTPLIYYWLKALGLDHVESRIKLSEEARGVAKS